MVHVTLFELKVDEMSMSSKSPAGGMLKKALPAGKKSSSGEQSSGMLGSSDGEKRSSDEKGGSGVLSKVVPILVVAGIALAARRMMNRGSKRDAKGDRSEAKPATA